jgi:hypothetical protein
MAFTFRYRYVDFSTVFTGDPQLRGAESGADAPGTLFANEIALDVGRTCWGLAEPLAIIDHHFAQDGQFPSTTAAVLHKSGLIHQKFTTQAEGIVWLVTHKEPDFDAFCSMYLARWIIERDAAMNWEPYGLHPDGWLDLNGQRRIDWFDPDLGVVPAEHRWALLLAGYASRLNNNRPILCPRPRAIHSVLYAALKRGRDYLANGAQEFFAEVQTRLRQGQLNPVFDSVLQDSTQFAPELTMLDQEEEAYPRDLERARKAIVYLPEAEAPSPKFFKSGKDAILLPDRPPAPEIDAEHLLLADSFRIATDGIYLRDPECQLFREWARLDLENSSLGAGYEFTAMATSDGRPAGTANQSEYVFSIDPGRANGRHLYTVWSRLQTTEVEALRAMREEQALTPSHQDAHTLETLLSDPWSEGQDYLGTLVDTPHRGTLIGPAGTRGDLRDDPVAEAVRTELEGSIYSAESLVTGPQVTVIDFAAENRLQEVEPRRLDLNAPLQIPRPPEKYFRFGSIRLRADVPITLERGLAMQIAEVLWQVLYPETPGALPDDFAAQHVVVTSDNVGVWSARGIVIAEKQRSTANARSFRTAAQPETELREDFAAIAALRRDVRDYLAERKNAAYSEPANTAAKSSIQSPRKNVVLRSVIAQGEELLRRAGEIEQALTLPGRELLRRFYQGIGVERLIASLRESHAAAVEQMRRDQQAERTSRSNDLARSLALSKWLIAFLAGLLAAGIIELVSLNLDLQADAQRWLALLGGPVIVAITALLLKPWKRNLTDTKAGFFRSPWWLVAGVVAFVLAWLTALSNTWNR